MRQAKALAQAIPLTTSGNLANNAIATATPAVSISKVRTENRIGGRGASLVGLVLMGNHGRAMQNAAEAIADQSGTFHNSVDGRLWSESVHA
ncbi:hypothetical protein SH528x_002056 [Novipirellula sp. SH528]|uniref:hypothetical protein n=1 Tax=Novipirellula sp. SH528 TaxID=3454466 RepID=UPI003F9ED9D9